MAHWQLKPSPVLNCTFGEVDVDLIGPGWYGVIVQHGEIMSTWFNRLNLLKERLPGSDPPP